MGGTMEIFINGKRYTSLEEVPPQLRALVADANGNGLPDAFEGLIAQAQAGSAQDSPGVASISTSSYVVDGKSYASAADLPPEARQALEAAGLHLGPVPEATPPQPATAAIPVEPPSRGTLLNGVPLEEATRRRPWWKFWA